MIRYALHCDKGHAFESWFQNSAAYDKQRKRSLVACPVCSSTKVEKAMMAPSVGPRLGDMGAALPEPPPQPVAQAADPVPAPAAKAAVAVLSTPERELRQKLKELRDHITNNANYVGKRFPEEARKIHYGEAKQRSIYGEASPDEAKELHDEGIEFHPIPILPDDQN
jgi:hypothetical protein